MSSLPLPLTEERGTGKTVIYDAASKHDLPTEIDSLVRPAIHDLGLSHAVGCLRFLQVCHNDFDRYGSNSRWQGFQYARASSAALSGV